MKWKIILLTVIVVVGGGFGYFKLAADNTDDMYADHIPVANDSQLAEETSAEVDEEIVEPVVEDTEDNDSGALTLREFADNDFRIFYDQLLQPGLLPIENSPHIFGDDVADARIREIAESRGYKLRRSPSVELASVDGYVVQAPLVQGWKDLKAAAASEGLSLSLVSAYRSVNTQRSLFTQRLKATGATVSQVANGLADDKVNEVLVTSSIPGYSKHHTGYAVDLACAGYGFEGFKNSPCNAWLVANNYKVAKEHGFIPSYPPLADNQGPDPEAWEFVWVGVELLH